jgi:curved DNA-binding protein CbpA
VLGVTPEHSDDEIKKVYRRRSAETHPDKARTDEEAAIAREKFQMTQEAFEVIKADRGIP